MIVYTRLDRLIMPADYYRNVRRDITPAPDNAKHIRPDIPRSSEKSRDVILFPHTVP